MTAPNFLHVTDVHLRAAGSPLPRDTITIQVPAIAPETREGTARHLFAWVARHLRDNDIPLDGILFSGDAQSRGLPGGHDQLLEMLLSAFGPLGITPQKVLATPGNHDVPRGSAPGSAARYEAFMRVWNDAGCVVPWFDGVDPNPPSDPNRHRLLAADHSWVVYPINSANWCQVTADLPSELANQWDRIPDLLSPGNADLSARLREQLAELRRYDIARISPQQLGVLRDLVSTTPQPDRGPQLRIGVLHHHLRSPSQAEELRPFEHLTNLEQLREFLREQEFSLLIHGHKHHPALLPDDIYQTANQPPHHLTVLSGTTFDEAHEGDAVRLVQLAGLPHVPNVTIQAFPLPRQGADPRLPDKERHRLWQLPTSPGGPVVVQSNEIDQLYDRVMELAATDAKGEMLIAHLDSASAPSDPLPQPSNFLLTNAMASGKRAAWLEEVVAWWQLNRAWPGDRFPYPHGSRLHHFAGKADQIRRVIALLSIKPTTQAMAVLVDPIRDFSDHGRGDNFASFCLVQFRLRSVRGNSRLLDVVGYYRVQEFAQWWPVNVAELRSLQRAVSAELVNCDAGRVTTIAAEARLELEAPVQVAIATLDRWHDLYPVRLHALAMVLSGAEVATALRQVVIDGWHSTLDELERIAGTAYKEDGSPIPTVGVALLIDYLGAGAIDASPDLTSIRDDLHVLAGLNAGYLTQERDPQRFANWAQAVLQVVRRMRTASQHIFEPNQP